MSPTDTLSPGATELVELLRSIEEHPERPYLRIPCSPTVVRWLLRGTFTDKDGHTARMIGGTLRGLEFTPLFREDEP